MKTIKCMWLKLNEVVDLDTGEIIAVSPYNYLADDILPNLPAEAFITYYTKESEVLVRGRFLEKLVTNIVVNYMFIDKNKDIVLEHNSSLESPESR